MSRPEWLPVHRAWVIAEARTIGRQLAARHSDAVDIEAQAMVRAWQVLTSRPDCDEPYLRRCMWNAGKNAFATMKSQRKMESDLAFDACREPWDSQGSERSAEAWIDAEDRREELARAIVKLNELPEEERFALLAYAEGTIGLAVSIGGGSLSRVYRVKDEALRRLSAGQCAFSFDDAE